MVGREAASQIAAASLASFLPLAPWLRYGSTSCAEMIRGSRPSAASLRAQWCALELASMATMQPLGRRAHHSMNLARATGLAVSTRFAASTPCTWITRLARSTPTRTAPSRITLSMGLPLSLAAD